MIYLDHAAATPVLPQVFDAMRPYFSERFYNPSSPYLPAVELRHDYEAAKTRIANQIGAKAADLIITASATESINLAFKQISQPADHPNSILISAVEHPAIFANAKQRGNFQTIKVDINGRIDLADFARQLQPQTQFVSVCLASGELGTIQPIAEIAHLVATERLRRQLAGETLPLYFHCDASQAIGLLEVKINRLGIDLLTINAAKIYGPKGVAALWLGHNIKQPKALIIGGGQEMGLRSGTENVATVIGFAQAIEIACAQINSYRKHISALRNQLKAKLATCPQIRFLGSEKLQLANFLPITVAGLDAERLIFKLEQHSLYLSTGAACAASKGQKSAALAAIGLSDAEIAGSLRISLGRLNKPEDIDRAGELILSAIQEECQRLSRQKGAKSDAE